MARITAAGAAIMVVAAVAGCGGTSSKPTTTAAAAPTTTAASASSESFDRDNWELESDPSAHKGASVDFVGKVFTAPERDAKGVYLQVWEDARNSENNTIVAYADPSFQVQEEDYVHVVGTVKGKFSGKNAFGAQLTVPTVLAQTLKVVPATAAASPALSTLGRATSTQAGITISVSKVEFADDETRVFLRVHNGSNYGVSVYDSSMKAVQSGRQYDSTYSNSGYPEISSDLLAGAATSGVVVFPKMNPNGNLKLVVEANSEDSNVGRYGTLSYIFTWR